MDDLRPQGFRILPPAIKNLLIANGLMFLLKYVLQRQGIDLTNLLGLHFFASDQFHGYQLVTHMFMHANLGHIFFNMFALWMFGSVLENVWGAERFLIFYFLCGLGGAFTHLGVSYFTYEHLQQAATAYDLHPDVASFATLVAQHSDILNSQTLQQFIDHWNADSGNPAYVQQSIEIANQIPGIFADIPIIGASGAVFGVLLAYGVLFPNSDLYFFGLVPIKAKYFVTFYALSELVYGVVGTEDGIAHFAHVGGAVVGLILVKLWNPKRRDNFQ